MHNRGSEHRVHLVLDTVGGARLWDLVAQTQDAVVPIEPQLFAPGGRRGAPLLYERVNSPQVMSPWEIRCHVRLLADMALPHPLLALLLQLLERFIIQWGALWAAYGDLDEGRPSYRALLAQTAGELQKLGGGAIMPSNELPFYHVLERLVFEIALAPPASPAVRAA